MRLVLCLLLLGVLPIAQGKGRFSTIEEAQAYLQRALLGSRYTDHDVEKVQANIEDSYRQANNPDWDYTINIIGEGVIVDASALGRCRSRILQDYSEVQFEVVVRENQFGPVTFYRREKFSDYANGLFVKSPGGHKEYGENEGFNWGELYDIRILGDHIEIQEGFPLRSSMVRMAEESLADAAGQAMQFLYEACKKELKRKKS